MRKLCGRIKCIIECNYFHVALMGGEQKVTIVEYNKILHYRKYFSIAECVCVRAFAYRLKSKPLSLRVY